MRAVRFDEWWRRTWKEHRLDLAVWAAVAAAGLLIGLALWGLPWHRITARAQPELSAMILPTPPVAAPQRPPLPTQETTPTLDGNLAQPTLPENSTETQTPYVERSPNLPDLPPAEPTTNRPPVLGPDQRPGETPTGQIPRGPSTGRPIRGPLTGGPGRGLGASFINRDEFVRGRDFVYVLDRSGSMDVGPLEAIKEHLRRSITDLVPRQRFYVIFYDDTVMRMWGNALVPATDENKRRCFEWLTTVVAGGGTDPTEALGIALDLEPDAIFFMSDGIFDPTLPERIHAENRERIPIHTYGFPNGSEPVLQALAAPHGGKFNYVTP